MVGTKNPASVINERRSEIWNLLIKGYNAQAIKKELNLTNPTVYRDIQFLTKKSKQYVYDVAKGLHALSYQKSIEGIGLVLSEAWNKFYDQRVQEKQRLGYLRLAKECSESMYQLTANGPTVMAVEELRKKIERAGINVDYNNIEDERAGKYDSTHIHHNIMKSGSN
jgi:IS30 family transposase